LEFLKLFVPVDMEGSFPIEPLHATFGLTVHELEHFKDFSLSSGMLSAIVNVANSAQICPKTKL
jgi:hypothetical protein